MNLTGVWKTSKTTVRVLLQQCERGAVILISSTSGLTARLDVGRYAASNHAVNGLMRTLSPLQPTVRRWHGRRHPGRRVGAFTAMYALPIPFLDPIGVRNAMIYLASDDGRFITGTTHVIDAGALDPFTRRRTSRGRPTDA